MSEVEARTRLTASIVAGGMLLNGDDVRDREANERVLRLFANREVIALAKKAPIFRPLEGDTGQWAADAFVCRNGKAAYLALFNFEREKTKLMRIDLARAGLPVGTYQSTDLWEGATAKVQGTLTVNLVPRACTLLRLEP